MAGILSPTQAETARIVQAQHGKTGSVGRRTNGQESSAGLYFAPPKQPYYGSKVRTGRVRGTALGPLLEIAVGHSEHESVAVAIAQNRRYQRQQRVQQKREIG